MADDARAALERGSWPDAYRLYSRTPRASMTAQDLQGFADAAWWTSRLDESLALRAEAYRRAASDGEHRRAAYNAWFLAFDLRGRGETGQAASWLSRAKQHLADDPDCYESGLIALAESGEARAAGDSAEAEARARDAKAIGERCANPDLVALATQTLGTLRARAGDVRSGVRMLDEAMSSVVAGELSPLVTGWMYCEVISACIDVADLSRAAEWAETARKWTGSIAPTTPYHGLCRIYRVQVTALRGNWGDAEREAMRATDELLGYEPSIAGFAFAALGEIRRRRGDLTGAEDALLRAHELGHDPQPSLALIRLAQGNVGTAAAALRPVMDAANVRSLERARALGACVTVFLVAGDRDGAASACALLDEIAGDGAALDAFALTGRGALALFDEQYGASVASLRHAFRLWSELKLPYEAAQSRVLLGDALAGGGDLEGARMEWKAAAAGFERLGAVVDHRAVVARGDKHDRPGGLTPREIEVLRLIAAGKTNKAIAGSLVISEHTVGRHVQNIFAKLGVTTRSAATAYAFEHGVVV